MPNDKLNDAFDSFEEQELFLRRWSRRKLTEILIHYGNCPAEADEDSITYGFETDAEAAAFLMGISQGLATPPDLPNPRLQVTINGKTFEKYNLYWLEEEMFRGVSTVEVS